MKWERQWSHVKRFQDGLTIQAINSRAVACQTRGSHVRVRFRTEDPRETCAERTGLHPPGPPENLPQHGRTVDGDVPPALSERIGSHSEDATG